MKQELSVFKRRKKAFFIGGLIGAAAMGLVQRWKDTDSRPAAYAKLAGMIETEPVKGTDLIDIKVYDTHPHWAADLANAVVEAYAQQRKDAHLFRITDALDMLRAREALQEVSRVSAFFRL